MFNKINERIDYILTQLRKVDSDATSRFHNAQTTLKNEIEKLKNSTHNELVGYERQIMAIPDLVECDVCGCLLKKETAIRGESRVKKVPTSFNGWVTVSSDGFMTSSDNKEIIEEVYYCKCHKPAVKTKTKKTNKK